jgi:hypothetical protein
MGNFQNSINAQVIAQKKLYLFIWNEINIHEFIFCRLWNSPSIMLRRSPIFCGHYRTLINSCCLTNSPLIENLDAEYYRIRLNKCKFLKLLEYEDSASW